MLISTYKKIIFVGVFLFMFGFSTNVYAAYCGDGAINQDWEQCDGNGSCTTQCQIPGEENTDLILSRIVVDQVMSSETGDLTSDLYIGSETNIIPQGKWFSVYQDGTYVEDPSILLYRNVPGLAVKRTSGQIQLWLNTGPYSVSKSEESSLTENIGAATVLLAKGGRGRGGSALGLGGGSGMSRGFEHVRGYIEMWGGEMADPEDGLALVHYYSRLERPFDGVKEVHPFGDEIWLQGGLLNFWMTVTMFDDNFIANYIKTTPSDVNNPPNPPTVTGPDQGNADTGYTFSFRATDPDGDSIRYAIDWNNDGVVNQYVPGSGYVSSGTSKSAQKDWSSLGAKRFSVRTQDSFGRNSSWVEHMIVISEGSGGDNGPPQCSDGIDNDGDGNIDAEDAGCSSIGDNDESDEVEEIDGTEAAVDISTIPHAPLVRKGEDIVVIWTATGVNSCTVSGPGISESSSSSSWSDQSEATIESRSIFTIVCQSDSGEITDSVTVQVVPGFIET